MKHPYGAGFVVCLRNNDYPVSLERRKIYRRVRDSNGIGERGVSVQHGGES